MYRVFNMGIGMIAVAAEADVRSIQEAARKAAVDTWVIGEIVAGQSVALV
jgi:phosphoribosylaminoimidazole (AIR) synthetase